MTTPCLTRQNAFLLEDNEYYTPFDLYCRICNESTEDIKTLFQPCSCTVRDKPYLAHQSCFKDWLIKNGCPTYCTACKSKYNTADTKKSLTIVIILATLLLIPLVYMIVHIIHCSEFETFEKSDIQSKYGQDTFKNIPEQIILPVSD